MSDVIVWGASGHASVVAELVRLQGDRIAAFVDDVTRGDVPAPDGAPLIRSRDALLELNQRSPGAIIIAVGDNTARLLIREWCVSNGLGLATAIHPAAVVSTGAKIGRGTVVMARAVVNTGAVIGECAIINSNSTVEHDCSIADGAHVGPGAHLGGKVSVGAATWIGIGGVIRDHICIGARSIIGAGSVVTRDIPDAVIAFGNPAKVVKSNSRK